jgi:hypothetical protein
LQPSRDERPIRVLACDEVEVLYDVWWPHRNCWSLTDLKGRATYYRISTQSALSKAKILRTEQLTEAEFQVHRPNLPLRCCRTDAFTWDELSEAALLEETAITLAREVITAAELVLVPFGPNGGERRGVKIQAQENDCFCGYELLAKASTLQSKHQASRPDGLGLYRLGFQNRVPSFYLWGWRDKANFTTD